MAKFSTKLSLLATEQLQLSSPLMGCEWKMEIEIAYETEKHSCFLSFLATFITKRKTLWIVEKYIMIIFKKLSGKKAELGTWGIF